MLRPAGEARQDQKWWVGIMSHLFGRIRRYYALRTSHDVVVAYSCLQLQICVELLDERLPIFPGTKSRLTITGQCTFPAATPPIFGVLGEWSPTRTEPHLWGNSNRSGSLGAGEVTWASQEDSGNLGRKPGDEKHPDE